MMKKSNIIFLSCFLFMILGLVVLCNVNICTAIGKWVIEDVNRGNYTGSQVNMFTNFMIVLILGTPIAALIFAIVRKIKRTLELRRLDREGKTEEYIEKAEKYK